MNEEVVVNRLSVHRHSAVSNTITVAKAVPDVSFLIQWQKDWMAKHMANLKTPSENDR